MTEENPQNLNIFVTRLRDLVSRPIAPPTLDGIAKDLYFFSRDLDAATTATENVAIRRIFTEGFEDLEKFRRSVPQNAWNIDRLMVFREKLMTLAARFDTEILRNYVNQVLATAEAETQQAQQTAASLQVRVQSAEVDVRLLKGRVTQLTDQLQQTQQELLQTGQQLTSTTETLRQIQVKWAQSNEALARANEVVEAGRNRAARIVELQAENERLKVILEESENARQVVEQWNQRQTERIASLERARDNLRAKLESALTPPSDPPAQTTVASSPETQGDPTIQQIENLYSTPPVGDTDLLEQLSPHN